MGFGGGGSGAYSLQDHTHTTDLFDGGALDADVSLIDAATIEAYVDSRVAAGKTTFSSEQDLLTSDFSTTSNTPVAVTGLSIALGASGQALMTFDCPYSNSSHNTYYSQIYDGTNIESLLSSVSWIYTHGNSDSGKSFEELNQKAMQSKIYGVCNTISIWILQILQEQNISSRLVQTMTLDEWNTYDNSHTMIEVYRNDLEKWVVYDLDNNVFFTYDEIPLSLVEFVDHVKNNDYDIVFLASDTKLDVSNFKSGDNDYDYAFVAESITSNEDTLRNWYERIIQVPLIQGEDLEFYFFDSKNQIKIENFAPNYHFIEETKFLNDFYG